MLGEEPGDSDGATVDAAGGLCEAQAGNWKVFRHHPSDGRVDYEIMGPTPSRLAGHGHGDSPIRAIRVCARQVCGFRGTGSCRRVVRAAGGVSAVDRDLAITAKRA